MRHLQWATSNELTEIAERRVLLVCYWHKQMESEESPDHSNVHYVKRPKRRLSRTRIVMGLLLIVAIPIFISLANKAVHENAEAIRQVFGR
jgi:hypothetical protein